MNKTNRILLIALVLQALLITGMRLGREEELGVRSVDLLESFDPDKVTKIAIKGAPKEKDDDPTQETVELVKTGATWGIGGADSYPADASKVTEFLKKLDGLRSHTVVLRSSKYHKKLEVAPDKYEREVTLTEEGKERRFYLGTSPSFKNVHVRFEGSDDVLLVNDLATSDAGSRAWSWVDRAYLSFPKKDVWSVRVENQHGVVAIEKNPADDQWMAPGVAGTLDTTFVNNVVNKASSINLESPVGKGEKPEYGLDKPLATVTLVTGTSTIAGTPPPSTETTTIKIGKKLQKENRYYLKSSRSEYTVEVAGWAVEPLVEKGPKDLLKKEEPPKGAATPTPEKTKK